MLLTFELQKTALILSSLGQQDLNIPTHAFNKERAGMCLEFQHLGAGSRRILGSRAAWVTRQILGRDRDGDWGGGERQGLQAGKVSILSHPPREVQK